MTPQLTATAEREAAFLRSLRPPELRGAHAEWYAAIVREANRIARADEHIREVKSSMEYARYAIEQDVWPRTCGKDFITGRWEPTLLMSYSMHDPVTCCWAIDVVGGRYQPHTSYAPAAPVGCARLYDLDDLARAYYTHTFNHISAAAVRGGLRHNASIGLVQRVAPVTWSLTDTGRELLALVFGEE